MKNQEGIRVMYSVSEKLKSIREELETLLYKSGEPLDSDDRSYAECIKDAVMELQDML